MSKQTTPRHIFIHRRQFLRQAAVLGLLPLVGAHALAEETGLEPSSESHVNNYNNYYEFSTNKEAVAHLAKNLTLEPWSLEIYHEEKPLLTLSLEEIKGLPQFQRTYRLRCVEGWSAVIPWTGIQLRDLIQKLDMPAETAYLKFEALYRPSEMLGQRRGIFPWPYTEGLRLDEALHPLAMLVFGMYGAELTPQCGAPLRLVVPWKYGFKSLKALTKITFTNTQPVSSWSQISPNEYGFYANVNPEVPHPRWSQRRELPLGQIRKVRTLPFNGYADEVAHLYKGMDLLKNY